MTREEAIARIRDALRRRSGRAWSVTGGSGTSYGWITISAQPRRLVNGCISDSDRAELSRLLGETVHNQGAQVPASHEHRREYCVRALTGHAATVAEPYWD